MSIKKCPGCGSEFRCEADRDCWCEKVDIHRISMLEILELYTDCICPECLGLYTTRE